MEIRTIQPFLHYFENLRERTMRVPRSIPPDQLDWSYAPGKFTFGDLLRHLAVSERFVWAETIQGHKSRYTTHGKELADGYENVISFVERLHAESMEIFARFSDEDLQRKCKTPDDAEITRWKWLRLTVEHEIHHRGQIYLYLGMLGVPTPPMYGLTSEQVRARSSAK